jgi:RNA polymerase-interacting CarD/CdnL/TRCF family regulator
MTFPLGSQWAYLNFGIGTVIRTGRRIDLMFADLKIELSPKLAEQRLRPLLDADGALDLLALLSAATPKRPTTAWVRRVRAYREVLAQGLPEEVAEIYRDLGRKQVLTYSELHIFRLAQKMLIAEVGRIWEDAGEKMKEAAQCLR